jgi:hypothetical protein
MADSIGRINIGGNSYGMGGYVSQRKEKSPQETPAEAPVIREETQVDGNEVLNFLAANAPVINKPETTTPAPLAPDVAARVMATMPKFEEMMALIEKEFGVGIAPEVMNLAMDNLI